jgi:hypothetical protein
MYCSRGSVFFKRGENILPTTQGMAMSFFDTFSGN